MTITLDETIRTNHVWVVIIFIIIYHNSYVYYILKQKYVVDILVPIPNIFFFLNRKKYLVPLGRYLPTQKDEDHWKVK